MVFSLANLRAIADADAQRVQPKRLAALPSFAGTELVGAPTPQAPTVTMPIARPVLAPTSNTPLVAMLGILLVTTIALAAYVVIEPRPQLVITRVVAATPDDASEPAPEIEPSEVAVVAPPRVEASAPPKSDEPPRIAEPRTNVRRDRARDSRTPERTTIVLPKQAEPAPKQGDVPLECVLDPNLPGCGGKAKAPPPKQPDQTPAIDPSLPETLGNTAIRDGIAPVKATAKQCGSKHGGTAGEKVRVKLSIVGATGAVSSTAAEDAHRGTALGNCVAAALKKATFPKFRKSVIGVEYTITL